ncbi:hypothetical protein Emed_007519 [Eimeria media]
MADPREGAPTGGPPDAEAKEALQPTADNPTRQQQPAESQQARQDEQQKQQQEQQEEQQQGQQQEQQQKQQGEQKEEKQEQQQQEQQQQKQQEQQQQEQQEQQQEEASDPQGTDSDMGPRASLGSRALSRSRGSSSVRVAVSGSGRLRFMSRGDSIASMIAAAGNSPSPHEQQQQQQQQRIGSSERLAHLISGSLSSVSCSNVAVAAGQEELADLFWNVADSGGAGTQLDGMRRRRTQFKLAEDGEGADSEGHASCSSSALPTANTQRPLGQRETDSSSSSSNSSSSSSSSSRLRWKTNGHECFVFLRPLQIPEALADDLREAASSFRSRTSGSGDWTLRRRRSMRFASRRRSSRPVTNAALQLLERMQQKFLPDIYEELQDRVRLRQQKRRQQQQQQQQQQRQQQQQEVWGEEEVYEVAGLPTAAQPAAKAFEESQPMEAAGSEALLMEVSFAPLDLDLAFQRFTGAKCLLGEGLDDDLRQLYRPPKADTTRLLEAGERKESPRSRLARLRVEVPDAIKFVEELREHAENEKASEQEAAASASGAAYILSLSQTLSSELLSRRPVNSFGVAFGEAQADAAAPSAAAAAAAAARAAAVLSSGAAAGLSTAVRERVAADVELQQALFTGGQQQQQQLSLLDQEETGGLVAPLFCPSSCVEMEQLARDPLPIAASQQQFNLLPFVSSFCCGLPQEQLVHSVQQPQQQHAGGAVEGLEVLDAAQLAGAGRAAAARRLLQLESRLNRLERVCLAESAAEGTPEPEVRALLRQRAEDPQAPSLAELASRLDNLLALASDPTPLSLLASRLSVVRCCMDEQQQQQQQQQEHHRQQQRQRWEDDRGALEDNEFSEFLPENIVLSLHRKLMPCKGIAEGLPRTTEALNRAKTSYAGVVSLVEAMTALGAQQQTLKEKVVSLHSIASSVSAASTALRRAEETRTASGLKRIQP